MEEYYGRYIWQSESEVNFLKYAFLLNEDKNLCKVDSDTENNFLEKLAQVESIKAEGQITKLGKLLAEKIMTHSEEEPDIFGPEEILKNSSTTLAPVMYRIAIEGFVKLSKAKFKIIECRNSTKLTSDWKPNLPDLLISLGHQVILIELKDEFSAYYNDFSYAILRQLNYYWKVRLPQSFYHPDDVCTLSPMPDLNLIIITPSLPDGELEFSNIKNKLQHDILTMLKNSCLSAMQNHLLLRDLRVGKLSDAMDGFECIRQIYRELKRRIKSGEEVVLGSTSEEFKLYMATKAGLTISSAESLLTSCKILDIERDIQTLTENWDNEDDENETIIELKKPVPMDKWNQLLLSRQSSETSISLDLDDDNDKVGEHEEDENEFAMVDKIFEEIQKYKATTTLLGEIN